MADEGRLLLELCVTTSHNVDALSHANDALSHATDYPHGLDIYIPLTQHISRPMQDTDHHLSYPHIPLLYLTSLASLYIPKSVSPYPNRLGSSSCLGLTSKQVLCSCP